MLKPLFHSLFSPLGKLEKTSIGYLVKFLLVHKLFFVRNIFESTHVLSQPIGACSPPQWWTRRVCVAATWPPAARSGPPGTISCTSCPCSCWTSPTSTVEKGTFEHHVMYLFVYLGFLNYRPEFILSVTFTSAMLWWCFLKYFTLYCYGVPWGLFCLSFLRKETANIYI